MSRNKLAVLLSIGILTVLFMLSRPEQALSLSFIKQQQTLLKALYTTSPASTLAAFTALYVLVTTFSLPGATILTLAAGAIFGLFVGTAVVSIASSLGATLTFLISRHLFRDAVRRRYHRRLCIIERGLEKNGPLYLLLLRLTPLVPFFVVNLVMGLTEMRAATFYLVSQVGVLVFTLIFVKAGTRLSQIESIHQIVSPEMLALWLVLGLLPLLGKRLLDTLKQ